MPDDDYAYEFPNLEDEATVYLRDLELAKGDQFTYLYFLLLYQPTPLLPPPKNLLPEIPDPAHPATLQTPAPECPGQAAGIGRTATKRSVYTAAQRPAVPTAVVH